MGIFTARVGTDAFVRPAARSAAAMAQSHRSPLRNFPPQGGRMRLPLRGSSS